MTDVAASPKVRGIQRTALAMLVLSGSINTIDRAALSVANPLIREDMHLSIAQMGLLLSAFLWAYAFAQLPTGALIDRLGPRRLLAIGLAVWSTAQLVCGLVTSAAQFAVARVLLGIGEAPNFPAGGRVVRDWFHLRQRGMATGVFNSASYIGTGIAAPLLTLLMLSFGWRWMFAIMGVLGLGAAVLWYALYRDPDQMALTAEENRYRTAGDAPEKAGKVTFAEWRALFRCRTTWGMILGYFGIIYVNWLFNAWLPGYLEMARHMSIRMTGLVAAVPYAFAVAGSLSGGWLADKLMARGRSRGGEPAISALHRHGGEFAVRGRGGDGGQQPDRGGVPVRFDVLRDGGDGECVGDGERDRARELHRVLGRDAEFRRLLRRCAGADDHRVHRAGDGIVRAGAAGGGGDVRVRGAGVPDDQGTDHAGGSAAARGFGAGVRRQGVPLKSGRSAEVGASR